MSVPNKLWERLKELTDTTNMFTPEDREYIEHMDRKERTLSSLIKKRADDDSDQTPA